MNSILRRISLVALLVAALAAFGAAAASAAQSTGGTLYVQQARGGELVKKGGSWRLVLHEPGTRTTTFSDRPQRVGGTMPLSRFVSSWKSSFGTVAPNAALEITGAPQSRNVVLLELSAPRYDASRHLLSFRAKPLTTSSDPALANLARQADRGVHGGFGHASLFIDSGDEGNVLRVEVDDMPHESFVEIGLADYPKDWFAYNPPATFMSGAEGMRLMGTRGKLFVECLGSSCSGSATISVEAPATEPLEIVGITLPPTGTVSASWAGGPTRTLPPQGGFFQLQPAKP